MALEGPSSPISQEVAQPVPSDGCVPSGARVGWGSESGQGNAVTPRGMMENAVYPSQGHADGVG